MPIWNMFQDSTCFRTARNTHIQHKIRNPKLTFEIISMHMYCVNVCTQFLWQINPFYTFWVTAIKITLKGGHGSVSSGIYKNENIQHFEVDIGATVTMTCSLFIQPAPFLFVMWHKADQIVSINAELSQVYRRVLSFSIIALSPI